MRENGCQTPTLCRKSPWRHPLSYHLMEISSHLPLLGAHLDLRRSCLEAHTPHLQLAGGRGLPCVSQVILNSNIYPPRH